MGNDFSYQDFSACSSHPAGSRVSFAYTPSNLSGSAPSLKTPPERVKSAPSTGRTTSSSRSQSQTPPHRSANDTASPSSASVGAGSGGDTEAERMYNGRHDAGRSAATHHGHRDRPGRNIGSTAAAVGTGTASSSDLSESDNEAVLNQTPAGSRRRVQQGSNELPFSTNGANNNSDRHHNMAASGGSEVTSSATSCECACHGSRDVVEALRSELRSAKQELVRSREQLAALRQNEAKLRQRLSEQARRQLEKTSTKFEDLSLGDKRPTQLIRRYGNLYTEGRLDALDALDDVTEMTEFTDLKGKLLLTILVLSFRNARKSLLGVKLQVRHLLHIPEVLSPAQYPSRSSSFDAAAGNDSLALDPAIRELDDVISVYLRKTVDRFDLTRNYEEVCQRVWDTLYDFPRLRQCAGLLRYIDESVRLSWALTVQNPPFCIQYEHARYSPDLHTRFHTSDSSSDIVRAVLWPVLTEGETGQCVYKGVVVT